MSSRTEVVGVSDPVSYTAVLPVRESTVLFVSGLLAAERRRRGTRGRRRALGCYRQAVRVLRWFLDGTRLAQLAPTTGSAPQRPTAICTRASTSTAAALVLLPPSTRPRRARDRQARVRDDFTPVVAEVQLHRPVPFYDDNCGRNTWLTDLGTLMTLPVTYLCPSTPIWSRCRYAWPGRLWRTT